MQNKVMADVDHAVADVADGAVVMVGGFTSAGTPTNLIRALVRQGATGLTLIANNVGLGDELDSLCAARQVAHVIASFAIRASGGRGSHFEQQYRAGEVTLELAPQGSLAERIRAGGAGIPAFYTPTGVGTPAAEGKDLREIDELPYVMETALTADIALLKAHRADTLGNLIYHGASRNFNVPMATAARLVIVEVDELVQPGEIDPNAVVTPGVYVDRIVQVARIPVRWSG